jgi:hypothetical protein
VWYHASDGFVEDAGWCAKVEGTTSSGVVSGHLSKVGMVLDCRIELASARLSTLQRLKSDGVVRRCEPSYEVVENVRFARKNSPEMFRASQRTTTTFWPLRSCFATILARRPSKCPLPSMTT